MLSLLLAVKATPSPTIQGHHNATMPTIEHVSTAPTPAKPEHDAQLDDPTPPLDHVPARSTEGLSFDDATSVILKSLSAIPHNGQYSTLLHNGHTGKDHRGFGGWAQARREACGSGGCTVTPVFFSPKNHTGRGQYTRTTCREHHRGGEAENHQENNSEQKPHDRR